MKMGSSGDLGLLTSRLSSSCSSNVFIHQGRFKIIGLERAYAYSAEEPLPLKVCWVETRAQGPRVQAQRLLAQRAGAVSARPPRNFRIVGSGGGCSKFFLEHRGGHESCDRGLTGGFREATELRGHPGRSPQAGARVGLQRSPRLSARGQGGWVGGGGPSGLATRRGVKDPLTPGRSPTTAAPRRPRARVDLVMLGLGRVLSPGCWRVTEVSLPGVEIDPAGERGSSWRM